MSVAHFSHIVYFTITLHSVSKFKANVRPVKLCFYFRIATGTAFSTDLLDSKDRK